LADLHTTLKRETLEKLRLLHTIRVSFSTLIRQSYFTLEHILDKLLCD